MIDLAQAIGDTRLLMLSQGRIPAICALALLAGCSGETRGTMQPGASGPERDASALEDASSDDEDDAAPGRPQPVDDASMAQCTVAEDCPSVDAFACSQGSCVEHACHALKPCRGTEVCEEHACVPFVPPERFPSGFFQSSGGGTATSAHFRLHLSAGAPQPMRTAQSGKYKLTLGAGAGRP